VARRPPPPRGRHDLTIPFPRLEANMGALWALPTQPYHRGREVRWQRHRIEWLRGIRPGGGSPNSADRDDPKRVVCCPSAKQKPRRRPRHVTPRRPDPNPGPTGSGDGTGLPAPPQPTALTLFITPTTPTTPRWHLGVCPRWRKPRRVSDLRLVRLRGERGEEKTRGGEGDAAFFTQ